VVYLFKECEENWRAMCPLNGCKELKGIFVGSTAGELLVLSRRGFSRACARPPKMLLREYAGVTRHRKLKTKHWNK
jgi:hypothetical protein